MSNEFTEQFNHRLDPSLGPEAVLFNDISQILGAATREMPRGDAALALAVLSILAAAILRAVAGDRRQLDEMAQYSCIAGQRGNARAEGGAQ